MEGTNMQSKQERIKQVENEFREEVNYEILLEYING